MVGKWHLGFDENGYDNPLPGGPIDHGFDTYFGIRASTDIPPYFYISGNRVVAPPTGKIAANNSDGWTRIQGEFWRAGGIAPGLELKDVLPRFTNEAIQVIDRHVESKSKRPLFLYLAYPAPHTPWLPSDDFVGKSGASMYGDFAMMVDHNIGRILDKLDAAKLSDDTLVIFTSDNGPVWYEEDVKRFGHDSSGGLRGMKADAWEGGHRMPFIARWPDKVAAGSNCDQLICFTDMLATFADINGQKLPDDAGPDSFSILPLLQGRNKPIRPSIAMRAGGGHMVVRKGDWKLIDKLGSGGFSEPKKIKPGKNDPTGQLYNLADDIGETKNRYMDERAIVNELKNELKRIQEDKVSRIPRD
jgi:arylsulfatase A-like enzyme